MPSLLTSRYASEREPRVLPDFGAIGVHPLYSSVRGGKAFPHGETVLALDRIPILGQRLAVSAHLVSSSST